MRRFFARKKIDDGSLVHLGDRPIILTNWKKNRLYYENLLVVIPEGWYKHASLGSQPGLPGPWLNGFFIVEGFA